MNFSVFRLVYFIRGLCCVRTGIACCVYLFFFSNQLFDFISEQSNDMPSQFNIDDFERLSKVGEGR